MYITDSSGKGLSLERFIFIISLSAYIHSSKAVSLGCLRNDMMIDSRDMTWRQVELNTIASGFGHLGPVSRVIQRCRWCYKPINHLLLNLIYYWQIIGAIQEFGPTKVLFQNRWVSKPSAWQEWFFQNIASHLIRPSNHRFFFRPSLLSFSCDCFDLIWIILCFDERRSEKSLETGKIVHHPSLDYF